MTVNPFEDITQRWFVTEPAAFSIYCSHRLEANAKMSCPIRSGHGKVEYNPDLLPEGKDAREELLFTEMVRIMLLHPYSRQPENVSKEVIALASNVVLADQLPLNYLEYPKPADVGLEPNHSFEWYADQLKVLFPKMNLSPEEKESLEEQSEYWEDDEFVSTEIANTLRHADGWGSIPGKCMEMIKANLKAKIDYRKVLAGFRASVASSLRNLTRMRPNRRFGFEAMGSKHKNTSKLLVAIDVSGSINSNLLSKFFGVIFRFFKFGICSLDVVQFDTEIKGEAVRIDKSFSPSKDIKIVGRGGTSFQCVFDYLRAHNNYDGMIIFTDGCAPEPVVDFHTNAKVLWVCDSKNSYENYRSWMEKTGRSCYINTDK